MTLKLSLLRWCTTLIGVQLLCGLVWALGPLLPVLEPWPQRLSILLALLLLWAVANFAIDLRRTRREAVLSEGVSAGTEQTKAIGANLTRAMAAMRRAHRRRGYLYEQPWYAIIGPPGAGKTTALLNAGLVFPLTEELGSGPVAGVGGTRLCDWWFTQDAVLIDTAGRYTTHESSQEVDRAGWLAFLSLLRKTRPRQPLNGVLVAISLRDVVAEAPLVGQHARAVRERLRELDEQLGVRLPVYLLFTKADLLIGFSEFFADLDRAGRAQVWGLTSPLDGPLPTAEALQPLLDRLNRREWQRLDAEPNADRRALIAGFPAQFASVLSAIEAFITTACGADATGRAPFLRGIYLTSATQEGAPIDRLIGALSRSFGLDQRAAPHLRPESGRSFFLTNLLRDVVFREAMLVAHRPAALRRRRALRRVSIAACLLVALLGTGALYYVYHLQRNQIEQALQHFAEPATGAGGVKLDLVADADFATLLPLLDDAAGRAEPEASAIDQIGFGQTAKLTAADETFYRHALQFALFPRLVWRAESRMRGSLGQPEALYEATRVYLMLGGGPVDPLLIQGWFGRDWDALFPQPDQAQIRAALRRHVTALLERPLPEIALDGPLIKQARAVIGQVPLARRAYSRLKPLAAARAPPPWRPSDALGLTGTHLFLRLSGRSLEDGVPGLFTVVGLHDVVLPLLPRIAQQAEAESWVVGGGPVASVDQTGPKGGRPEPSLEQEMIRLYAAEYIAAWNDILADLDPAPMRSVAQAAQDLFILASAHSPIRGVLASAAEQLSPAAAAPADAMTASLTIVDQAFHALRVTATGDTLTQLLRQLSDLQQQLAKQAASAVKLPAPAANEDAAVALRAEALRQPQPVARWLASVASSGAALRDGGPRGAMIIAWNAIGGPGLYCQGVISGRYPFAPESRTDVSLDDFTRLLGPGGAIDAYFNAYLRPYVVTTQRSWRLQAIDGVNAPLLPADLAQFQRAAAIRDLYFPGALPRPAVRFDLTPDAIDLVGGAVTLDLGGAQITAEHGVPARPVALSWPLRAGATLARLTVTATPPARSLQLEADGPWSVFRLFASARINTFADRSVLQFSGNARSAQFDLRANPYPFATTQFSDFRCPTWQ